VKRRSSRTAGQADRWAVRSALWRFALGATVTLGVLVLISILIARVVARDATLDEASDRTTTMAETLAAPLVTPAFRRHDPRAVHDLARLMTNRMSDATIRHVKIWSDDGTILWSDESELIGRRFSLEADQVEALGSPDPVSEFSDLSDPENVSERNETGPILETYVGVTGRDGRRVLFETYMSPEQTAAPQESIVRATVLVGVAALVVFALAVFPLSLRLARGVERAHVDRERMTRHALLSSELERRRMAQELHDGVIQDLAGAGLVLPLVAQRVTENRASREDGALLARLHDLVTLNVHRLRSLMAEVYPPDLTGTGLFAAIENLVLETAEQLDTEVHLDPSLRLGEGAAQLAYRIVREGLRNVVKHAEATTAVVEIRREDGWVHVLVADDGQGLAEDLPDVDVGATTVNSPHDGLPAEEGHLGLRLLSDYVTDAGGSLELVPNRPQGTRLRASFLEDVPGFSTHS
jgi:signal transduction histidine kinase